MDSSSSGRSARSVSLASETDEPEPSARQWLKQHLCAVMDRLQLHNAALNFVIVGDERMRALHEQFAGVAGTTDVLSFDFSSPPLTSDNAALPARHAVEGEIYLCIDEARRHAQRRGHPTAHELLLYATHGLLHLLGYDDHTPEEHRRMHQREDRLLEAIGVGAVYGADHAPITEDKPPSV